VGAVSVFGPQALNRLRMSSSASRTAVFCFMLILRFLFPRPGGQAEKIRPFPQGKGRSYGQGDAA
jgi:hypothetical protein